VEKSPGPWRRGDHKFVCRLSQELMPILTRLGLLLIRAYQLLAAPLIPSCCRFHPSCSHYAAEALTRHGFFKGSYLTLRRLGRCHPFNPGGWDPVP
jgi:putative membrane protein insertion efficiency factor